MKKLFALIVTLGFVSNAFADDWRMRKFDLDADKLITKDELEIAGCNYKATTFFFDRADKNGDDFLNTREARNATEYIFKSNCPRNPIVLPKVDGIRG
jgi:hypothetical protein